MLTYDLLSAAISVADEIRTYESNLFAKLCKMFVRFNLV